ncbi:hypothetical protein FJM67_08195 [Maribrevibacterium harenarium]|uniref:Uncharacterized protein n=1 Tax=Maribrevibacterium harenarium TaxID=2589817 RepID=A0A501WR53_9GAMM|nr:hypothetical protein [Maribrevibacterium harenarium]TPE51949.1 hypothetical protein FJM67_08195 [Maribrevibacterium harenarium]
MTNTLLHLEDCYLSAVSYAIKASYNGKTISKGSIPTAEILRLLIEGEDFRRTLSIQEQTFAISRVKIDNSLNQIALILIRPDVLPFPQQHSPPKGLDVMYWNERGETEFLWLFSGEGKVEVSAKINECSTYTQLCSPIEFLRLFNQDGTLPKRLCFDDHPFQLSMVKFNIQRNSVELVVTD